MTFLRLPATRPDPAFLPIFCVEKKRNCNFAVFAGKEAKKYILKGNIKWKSIGKETELEGQTKPNVTDSQWHSYFI